MANAHQQQQYPTLAHRQPAPANRLEDLVDPTRMGHGASIEQILAATEERKVTSIMEQAKIGFRSKYLPKHIASEDQAIAIALAGAELGIAPMTAFRAIYFFDGRIVLSSQLLVAMAHRKVDGFRLDIVKATEAGCWVAAWRPGMTEPARFYFTVEDAQRAGLMGKDNWKKYPGPMCIARASAMAVRAVAPEASMGILTTEEHQDGVRYEVDLAPGGGLELTEQKAHASPVDALKNDLRNRAGQGSSTPATPAPADKKAARAQPPAGFEGGGESSAEPPPGFPKPKASKAKTSPAVEKGEAKPASTQEKSELAPTSGEETAVSKLLAEMGKLEMKGDLDADNETIDRWWADCEHAIAELTGDEREQLQKKAAKMTGRA